MSTVPNHTVCWLRHSTLLAVAALLSIASIDARAEEPGPLDFAYGFNVFALDDTSSLVELDYQYSERGLTYADDGENKGRLYVSFQIWDSTGRALLESSWITTNPRPKKG